MKEFIRLVVLFCLVLPTSAQQVTLRLPTENDFLFRGQPKKFYMYVHRDFEGKKSTPWQAGSYGYVRNLKRNAKQKIVATKFHEGLDIQPLKRDTQGRPLDLVNAIAPGEVVHINAVASNSNYGKYVVIKHNWGSGDFYSLYAHLSDITCKKDQRLLAGSALGRLGDTGIDANLTLARERAHVHLELNLMLSSDFQTWYDAKNFESSNLHGQYNGINLAGLDLGKLYLELHENPQLTITEFIKAQSIYFKVTLPRKGRIDLIDRYPWICPADPERPSPSWEISFTSSGFPTKIIPSNRVVKTATVTSCINSESPHSWRTRNLIEGKGFRAQLSTAGLDFLKLIAPSSF